MPPYFFRYSQEDIREFYMQFAAALGRSVRIFLYNIPFFTTAIPPNVTSIHSDDLPNLVKEPFSSASQRLRFN